MYQVSKSLQWWRAFANALPSRWVQQRVFQRNGVIAGRHVIHQRRETETVTLGQPGHHLARLVAKLDRTAADDVEGAILDTNAHDVIVAPIIRNLDVLPAVLEQCVVQLVETWQPAQEIRDLGDFNHMTILTRPAPTENWRHPCGCRQWTVAFLPLGGG